MIYEKFLVPNKIKLYSTQWEKLFERKLNNLKVTKDDLNPVSLVYTPQGLGVDDKRLIVQEEPNCGRSVDLLLYIGACKERVPRVNIRVWIGRRDPHYPFRESQDF